MEIILYLLAMYSFSFMIKEMSGPFDIISKIRNKLMINKYVGVFFYKLLSCYYCTGCYSGWFVYLLVKDYETWLIKECVLWILAGGAISFIMDKIVEKINN